MPPQTNTIKPIQPKVTVTKVDPISKIVNVILPGLTESK